MAKKGHSDPDLFGGYTHYDEYGKKTGSSRPGLFGGYVDYDAKGNRTGRSEPNLFGGYTHYDNKGRKTGRSEPGLTGFINYDKNGNRTGRSDRGLFGGYDHSDNEGCYIATCVYGSYDCPEVWTLRRFRDYGLRSRRWGKALVRGYYAVSPAVVKHFGKIRLFREVSRLFLDRFMKALKRRGYIDLPYADRESTEFVSKPSGKI